MDSDLRERVRANVKAYLEPVSVDKNLYEYEKSLDVGDAVAETVEMWFDNFQVSSLLEKGEENEIFSFEEVHSLLAVNSILKCVCDSHSLSTISTVQEMIGQKWWESFQSHARYTLEIFKKSA